VQAKLGGKVENGPLLQLEDSKPYCVAGSKPLDLMLCTLFISKMMNYPDSTELSDRRLLVVAESRVWEPLLLQNPPGNEGQ
jgi:hypothetical protein